MVKPITPSLRSKLKIKNYINNEENKLKINENAYDKISSVKYTHKTLIFTVI